jgi:hypothetical protein
MHTNTHTHTHTWQVDTLSGAQRAAVVDLAPDVAALFLNDRQRDKAVVDEDL